MTALLKPCVECGELTSSARCTEHTVWKPKPYRALGYDAAWDRLSKRARRMQPWCSRCGTTQDLTCDHSEEAWRRREAGLAIRLCDVDVLCRSCNAKKGRARPPRGDDPQPASQSPRRQSGFASHTPGGYA